MLSTGTAVSICECVCACVTTHPLLSLYIQINWIPPGFSLSLSYSNTHKHALSQPAGCGPKLKDVSGEHHIAKASTVAPMPLLTVLQSFVLWLQSITDAPHKHWEGCWEKCFFF